MRIFEVIESRRRVHTTDGGSVLVPVFTLRDEYDELAERFGATDILRAAYDRAGGQDFIVKYTIAPRTDATGAEDPA